MIFQAVIVFQDIKLPAVKIFISDVGKMIIKHPGKMPYLCYIYLLELIVVQGNTFKINLGLLEKRQCWNS